MQIGQSSQLATSFQRGRGVNPPGTPMYTPGTGGTGTIFGGGSSNYLGLGGPSSSSLTSMMTNNGSSSGGGGGGRFGPPTTRLLLGPTSTSSPHHHHSINIRAGGPGPGPSACIDFGNFRSNPPHLHHLQGFHGGKVNVNLNHHHHGPQNPNLNQPSFPRYPYHHQQQEQGQAGTRYGGTHPHHHGHGQQKDHHPPGKLFGHHGQNYGSKGPSTSNPKKTPNSNTSNSRAGDQLSEGQSQSNSSLSTSSDSVTPGTTNPIPQYRIIKRGDTISGPKMNDPNPPRKQVTIVERQHSSAERQLTKDMAKDKDSLKTNEAQMKSRNDQGPDPPGAPESQTLTSPPSGHKSDPDPVTSTSSSSAKTPVTQVSEIARYHKVESSYHLISESGPPHAPKFLVTLTLGTEKYEGEDSSIKRAQLAAATLALANTSYRRPPPRPQPKRGPNKRPNWALVQLTALADELKVPLRFILQPVPIPDPFRRGDPPSIVSVQFGDSTFSAQGPSFQIAKNNAALLALKGILKAKQEEEISKMIQDGTSPGQLEEKSLEGSIKSPISIVHEMGMKRGLTVKFELIEESGPPHLKSFKVKCVVGEEESQLETEGEGQTKQIAKKIACELMIQKLREIPIPLPTPNPNPISALKARNVPKQKLFRKKVGIPVLKDLEKLNISSVSRLIQLCHSLKLKEPEFSTPPDSGERPTGGGVNKPSSTTANPNDRRYKRVKTIFTIQVKVGETVCTGSGPNKKAAKKAAAEAALQAMGQHSNSKGGSRSKVTFAPNQDKTRPRHQPQSKSETISMGLQPCLREAAETGDGSGQGQSQESLPSSFSSSAQGSNDSEITSARQIVPGVYVLNKSPSPKKSKEKVTVSEAFAENIAKIEGTKSPVKNSSGGGTGTEGGSLTSTLSSVDTLSYLARLLDFPVSYSDFPKNNEFLSVVSVGTHVSHGIGPTLQDARILAAQRVLSELTDMGLDNVSKKGEGSTVS